MKTSSAIQIFIESALNSSPKRTIISYKVSS